MEPNMPAVDPSHTGDMSNGNESNVSNSTSAPKLANALNANPEPVVISPNPVNTAQPQPNTPEPTPAILTQTQPLNTPTQINNGMPPNHNPVLGVPVTGGFMGASGSGGPSQNITSAPGNQSKGKKKLLFGTVALLTILVGGFGYVFGFYLPNKPDNVYRTGLNRSGSTLAKVVDKISQKSQIEKIQNSEITANTEFKSPEGSFNGTFAVKLDKSSSDGALNLKIKQNDEAEKTLDLKFLSELPDNKVYPNLYFKITGLQSLGLESFFPEISSFEDKWIAAESDYLESLGGGAPKNRENITAEEIASLIKVFSDTSNEYFLTSEKSKAVLENKAFIGKETLDGLKTYHYQVGVNKPHAKDYCKALSERIITHATYKKLLNLDDVEIEDYKKDINKDCDEEIDRNIKDDLTLDMWIDAKYKLIHKLRIYDENDKGVYTDIGQIYNGGDDVNFFIAFHDQPSMTDVKFTVEVDTNTFTSKGSLVWTQKKDKDNEYDAKVTFEAKPYSGEVTIQKPADSINLQDILGSFADYPYNSPEPTAPSSNAPRNAKDTERKTDINALHAQLEAYYAVHGVYPTQGEVNNPTWRATNMRGLDKEALRDPDGTGYNLGSVATSTQYEYMPNNCTKVDFGCQEYSLGALLSTGTLYTKVNLN